MLTELVRSVILPKQKNDIKKRISGLQFLWLSLALIIVDQITKQWVIRVFDLYESIEIMPYLNFTYVQNFGAAFSFLSDQEAGNVGYSHCWLSLSVRYC